MPENLLLEPETAPEVAAGLDYIESLVHDDARKVGWAVEGMKGSADLFENIWRRIVINVASGQTLEMQEARPRFLRAFDKRLGLLRDTNSVAAWLAKRNPEGAPDSDLLLAEVVEMERFKARVLDRWQTAEDLEDLAARDYPLTTADLDKIGPLRKPPASYYTEQSKPF